jgi:hypothetical protein
MSEETSKIIDPMNPDAKLSDITGDREQKIVISDDVADMLNTSNVDVGDDTIKLRKIQKELFTEWLALPSRLRNPKNIAGFIKKYGIRMDSALKWQRDDDVIKRVRNIRKKNLVDRSSNVLDALALKAEKGETSAIKLYLQYVEEWAEDSNVNVSGSLAELMKELGNSDSIVRK